VTAASQLFALPTLDAVELEVDRRVEELRKQLSYAVQSRRWHGLLRRVTLARAIQGSNSIEGHHVTEDDALAAVDGEEPLEAVNETWEAIKGYRDAMTYVLQLGSEAHFEYSADLTRSLHYMMLRYDLTKRPGRWRVGDIFVRREPTGEVVYTGPPAEDVPPLMSALFAGLNSDDESPVLVRAAMAHLNLVMIHPFADGNGRMARCLQSLVLARTGIMEPQFCSIEEYLGRNTQDYYGVLAAVGRGSWQPQNDARPWVRFCLSAHYRQADMLLRRSSDMRRLWDELEALIHTRRWPDRVIQALSNVCMGFRLTNARYRAMTDVPQNLASRDLRMLSDAGLLEPVGDGRGRYYVASAAAKQLRQGTREVKRRIEDPFVEFGYPAGAPVPFTNEPGR
jgi:Fic family protein